MLGLQTLAKPGAATLSWEQQTPRHVVKDSASMELSPRASAELAAARDDHLAAVVCLLLFSAVTSSVSSHFYKPKVQFVSFFEFTKSKTIFNRRI
jgi:hypothetical protein